MTQASETQNTEILIPNNDKQFANIVQQVLQSVSHDTARPTLQGVLVTYANSAWQLVASDGYRLTIGYYGDYNVGDARSVFEAMDGDPNTTGKLLTVKSLKSLVKAAKGKGEYVEEIIPGRFPDYRRLIPEDYSLRADIDRDRLYRAAASCPPSISTLRVSLTPDTHRAYGYFRSIHDNAHPMQLEELLYSWQWPAPSQDHGQEFQFAVDANYLAQALQHSTCPSVKVSVEGTRTMQPIRLDTWDAQILLMPMEVYWEI